MQYLSSTVVSTTSWLVFSKPVLYNSESKLLFVSPTTHFEVSPTLIKVNNLFVKVGFTLTSEQWEFFTDGTQFRVEFGSTFDYVTMDTNITPNEVIEYEVHPLRYHSLSLFGLHSSFKVYVDGVLIDDYDSILRGSIVAVEVVSDEHYHFESWSDSVTDNPRVFRIMSDTVLKSDSVIDKHQVTVIGKHGSVTGQGIYAYGSTVTVSWVTESSSYRFDAWYVGNDKVSTENPYSFTVLGDIVIEGWPIWIGLSFWVPDTYTTSAIVSLNLIGENRGWDIEYSLNSDEWNPYTFGTRFTLNPNDEIDFRGTKDSQSQDLSNYIQFQTSGAVNAYGDVTSLVKKVGLQVFDLRSYGDYTFLRLFKDTTIGLMPELLATTMVKSCYQSMFEGCTNLTEVKRLRASVLADACYESMFYGCSSIVTVPASLPATTLKDGCYYQMFTNCLSLTIVPDAFLPATSVPDFAYASMFEGTSITTVPSLPATVVGDFAYANLFEGTKIVSALNPLSSESCSESCYEGMFKGCINLVTVSKDFLPSLVLAKNCYKSMFEGCSVLKQAPDLKAEDAAPGCYVSMFKGCTKLTA